MVRRISELKAACMLIFFYLAVAVAAGQEPVIKIDTSNLAGVQRYPGGVIASVDDSIFIGGGFSAAGSVTDRYRMLRPDGEVLPGKLPQALAYAASVSADDAVYMVGGYGDEGLVSNAGKLSLKDDGLVAEALPALPAGIGMAGLALHDGYLYCFGGLVATAPVRVGAGFYRLKLADPSGGWEALDAFPGAPRARAMLVVRDGAIYVMGGQQLRPIRDGEAEAVALSDCWEYRHVPQDGTTTRGWRQRDDLPIALAGAGVHVSGDAHALLIGGYRGTQPFVLDEPAASPMLSDDILIYHSITDTWLIDGKLPAPMADVAAVGSKGTTLLVHNTPVGMDPPLTLEVRRTVKKLSPFDYLVIVGYFCGMALVGVYFSKKQDSSEEFALGNRKVKWWAAAVSMFATGASSFSFMAIPAMAFRTNLVWFTPVLMFLVFYFFNAYFVYPLLRRLHLTSTYAYLEARFGKSLRLIASTQWLLAQFATMSVIMLLPAMAVSAVTGLNIFMCVLVLGLLTTLYTSIGGFEAVIWTDFAQGVLMLLGPAIMIVLAIGSLSGGFGEFVATASEAGKFKMAILKMDVRYPILWVICLGTLYTNMAFVSQQHVIQRVYATPLKDARRLAGMFAVIAVVISALVYAVGISLFAYFREFPEMMDPAMKTDQIVPLFIVQRLPTGLAGLLMAAIFAAAMSTLSSSMNSSATIFATDYYKLFKKRATDADVLRVMKRGSLVAGLFGTAMTLYMAGMQIESMFKTLMVFIALIGGGFIGIYILGMFTRRANTPGVVVGALGSIACVLFVKHFTPVHWMCYTPVAVTSCLILGYLFSLVLPHRQKDLTGLTVFDQLEEEVAATPSTGVQGGGPAS